MKLINASIVESVDNFLHAGYISAYPRPLEPSAYPIGGDISNAQKVVELNVQSALQLGESANNSEAAVSAGSLIGNFGSSELLFCALAAIGLLALYYFAKKWGYMPSLRPALSMTAVCAFLLATPNCDDGSGVALPTDPPWEGEQTQSYAHPEDATLVILHGIIRPAIANIGQRVDTLANIQDEVALPQKTMTEGERYALKMYGLDGFGNPFSLVSKEKNDSDGQGYWQYSVTSLGADGIKGTKDDISATFSQNINDNWGWGADLVYYIVGDGDDAALLYHRWNDEMFDYGDKDGAEEMTGSDLFDHISNDRLNAEQVSAINTAYASFKADSGSSPLVLQVFKI